jgi:large subunit ribosomal protein L32e
MEIMVKTKIMRKRRIKPRIRRSESWRYTRVSESWRRPTGKSSRMRKKRRGWALSPAIGYGSPRKYRGFHPSGLKEILIHNVNELENFSPDEKAIRIAATVGERKRLVIIEHAQQLGYKILNPRISKADEAETIPPKDLESEVEQTENKIENENAVAESEKSEKVEED